MRLTLVFLVLSLLHNGIALNILGIVSVPLRSHYMAFQTFFRELAARGHNVTVINNFPDTRNTSNLRFVNLNQQLLTNITSLEMYENINPTFLHWRNFYNFLSYTPRIVRQDCENLFTNVNAKKHLAEGNKYDVVFVELFTSDCALVYAADNFEDTPIIGLTSHVLLPHTYTALGLPFRVAADSFFFSKGGPNPSLLTKVEVAVMKLCLDLFDRLVNHRIINEVFQKHTRKASLDVESIAKDRMNMVFAYQHYSMTGARLLAPQLLEIGGLHITQPKPVSKDIQEFLSNAKHGAIYVSFGSNLNISRMSPRMLQNFLTAFTKVPQKFLIKWENDTFPSGHDNILTKKWFPQFDVLCHPKIAGFISHGGMLSSSEAIHCGKPMVTIPFFGDQFDNSASLSEIGFAKTLLFASITSEILANAISEITSPEMQQNARRVFNLWHDRPLPVMDSAIYWTEYVARQRNAPPSLPSKHTTWFEFLLIDVICIFALLLFIVVWLCVAIWKLMKKVFSVLLRKLFCKNKVKKQ
ncbi:unnamed protein product [Diatraea saccharalis]|uniref:UDP-glucuronosyltransferase n=1 Tax=Diatraea saccharalis TaxID=40085 RepID=A0A9N9QUJ0_9NEOP|nr:unnamed protein product [Diatraea saccharalis]